MLPHRCRVGDAKQFADLKNNCPFMVANSNEIFVDYCELVLKSSNAWNQYATSGNVYIRQKFSNYEQAEDLETLLQNAFL